MQSPRQPDNHIQFIRRPATEIVKEAISSLNATNGGIEIYPISYYLLHSLFLKLTGAQEQKLKCICWEIACRDYAYRYERYEISQYKECSSYKDKCMVFNDIVNAIKKLDNTFEITDDIRNNILKDWQLTTNKLFDNSLLVKNFPRIYEEYKNMVKYIQGECIMADKHLLTKKDNISPEKDYIKNLCGLCLNELYTNYIYNERNRCAHNTMSYQHNLPSLKEFTSDKYQLNNYFLYMSIILLLDRIYIELFNIYFDKWNK